MHISNERIAEVHTLLMRAEENMQISHNPSVSEVFAQTPTQTRMSALLTSASSYMELAQNSCR